MGAKEWELKGIWEEIINGSVTEVGVPKVNYCVAFAEKPLCDHLKIPPVQCMNITIDIPLCMNAAGQLIRRTPGSELAAVPARLTGSRAAVAGRRYASKYPVRRTIPPRRAAQLPCHVTTREI